MKHVIETVTSETKSFNGIQLATIRAQFAKLDRINDEHWVRIRFLVGNCDSRIALHQLAEARINFLSAIIRHYLERGVLRRP